MYIIIDNIANEELATTNKSKALRLAQERIAYHNSEFNYSHRGKHYSANATLTIVNNIITINYGGN